MGAHLFNLAEQMGRNQDCDPVGPELADQVPHLAGALRIEAVCRLVQHEQVTRLQQGGRDSQPLPHAERVVPVPLARRGRQPHPLQRIAYSLPSCSCVCGAIGGVEPT